MDIVGHGRSLLFVALMNGKSGIITPYLHMKPGIPYPSFKRQELPQSLSPLFFNLGIPFAFFIQREFGLTL
jgi:hypothetical protein